MKNLRQVSGDPRCHLDRAGADRAFGVILALVTPKVKWNAKMLATGALCIAIGFVLSYIRLLHMPQGGSITRPPCCR